VADPRVELTGEAYFSFFLPPLLFFFFLLFVCGPKILGDFGGSVGMGRAQPHCPMLIGVSQ